VPLSALRQKLSDDKRIRYQPLKCESGPLASLDNFWSEAISHFPFPDLLFTELQGILLNTSPTSAAPMIIA
jgi:hypothetical protein